MDDKYEVSILYYDDSYDKQKDVKKMSFRRHVIRYDVIM